jgi:hypothetical protein
VSAEAVPAISAPIRELERIFLSTLRPIESESFRPGEARQRRNAGIGEREIAEGDARLAANNEASDSAIGERGAQPPAFGELIDDRVRNLLDRSIDQNLVVGGAGPVSRFERAFNRIDAELARMVGKRRRALQRNDVQTDMGEDRRGVAGAGTDHERLLAGPRRHLGEQLAEHGRSGKEAPAAHCNRAVDISKRPGVIRQEALALDCAHRIEHQRIGHALRPQLVFDHRETGRQEIGDRGLDGHRCYMPVIHLKFKPVLSVAR